MAVVTKEKTFKQFVINRLKDRVTFLLSEAELPSAKREPGQVYAYNSAARDIERDMSVISDAAYEFEHPEYFRGGE